MHTIIQSDDKYIYNSLSIKTVLPSGIIQHIAAFNNLSNIKSMSKICNKCYQNNPHAIKLNQNKEKNNLYQK